ncbi:MAG: N-acetylmuramoyl-L-alanine amidase family protein [Gemmatimonadales bacterium]
MSSGSLLLRPFRVGWVPLLSLLATCARQSTPPPAPEHAAAPDTVPRADTGAAVISPELPAVPLVKGPLALRIVYPSPEALVFARDSSFLFGTAGTGEAKLAINGYPVRVWPNGAWLAWIPLPRDSVMQFRIEGRSPTDSAVLMYAVRRGGWSRRPEGLWVDSNSLSPAGKMWWPRGEYLTLTARASEGAQVRLRLADGTVVPLVPQAQAQEIAPGIRAFDRDTNNLRTPVRWDRYVGVLRGRTLGPDPGPILPLPLPLPPVLAFPADPPVSAGGSTVRCATTRPCIPSLADSLPPDSGWAVLEAIQGADTVRARWPLRLALLDTLPLMAELVDDTTRPGVPDSVTVGRALPGGTYHWFFPTGTRAPVGGRYNGDLRLRLSPTSEAWVATAEARPAPGAAAAAVAGSVTLTPKADRVTLRVPLSRRVPFRVTETERTLTLRLYHAVGDVNWMQYGRGDSLVLGMRWPQEAAEELTLTLDLSRPLWGYQARWSGGDLLLDLRRPPALDEGDPLAGRFIAVDPGHPPGGATGPTGLREAEANLAVALELRRLLQEGGARVLMTRTRDSIVELGPRLKLSEAANADLLISVHNNALPDGVNPFTNHGTSVYYNQPRSIPLAREIQTALVHRLGLRDLGVGRGDLAMVRGTWMPSVLTEGMFMILPEQEAALRTREGQHLYALGIYEGVRRFLRDRARRE